MENIKNPKNYKTLESYNTYINTYKNDHKNDDIVKEKYGAFSLYGAVRYPWAIPSSADKQPVIPGVN